MAFTLSTIYKAVDKFSGPVAAMEKANAKFAAAQSKSLMALRNSFTDVRNRLLSLAGNLSTAALVMTGFNAVKDFDESLASLRAITGLTGKAFIPFKKEIMAVGDATKMAYPEVAKAFELIGSAKPELLGNATAMGQMTKAAILLSKASGMDLTMSSMSLTKAMNQFGVGADQAAKFVDILSTSEQKGTATTQQIVESLVNGGSTAKTLGLSFDHTNAIIQAYAKAGVLGSEAGTQMASVLSKLATVTKKEFNPTNVGAVKAIDNLAKANLKYTDLLKLVGPEKAKFLATLLTQNDVVQRLAGNLYDQGNAQKQADERSRSFTVRIEQLTAKFKNLAISGNETSGVLNMFGGIIGFVTNHLGAILGVIGMSLGAYAAYYAVMTSIRLATVSYNVALGIFMAFQKAVPVAMGANVVAMKAYTVATNIAAFATKMFAFAFKTTPIGWIVVGITLIISLFKHMADRWEGIKKAFTDGGFLKGIMAIGKSILSWILTPVEWVLKALAKITGADWAKDLSNNFQQFKDSLDEGLVDEKQAAKPVNTIKTANDVQTQRYEEINKNQLSILLQNKSDKQVNVTKNNGMIPITTSTY